MQTQASNKQRLGRWGERMAESYLTARGYDVIERNARTPYGEIDLVMKNSEILVFVEVKTRSSDSFGEPEASVTLKKQAHLVSAIQAYMLEHDELEGDWRVDVIAIQGTPNKPNPSIVHFENALS